MHDFFEDEIPPEWERCPFCGVPLTLDVLQTRVIMWCKQGCRGVLDNRRVIQEDDDDG